ncbi:hypothetical protein [Moorena sp. SIO3H5]|uniref:hypothetical protein n=1 Tax=Moorena sp. SIO3H5 TaxID=2607834 RepID=UPI0013B7DBCF|nr:hypothetical protein [Moorena sp. SIO3H5]NEO72137.1 hypothetical protein [Moorena sp. SIO3H5]
MACGITSGIAISCEDLVAVGGVFKNAYVANLDDISTYTLNGEGYIQAINFVGYAGLYKLESRKQAHTGGYEATIQDPGGNKFYTHTVTLKLFPGTPDEDDVIEEILGATALVVILQDNNDNFFLYGKQNGLEQSAGTQNTGAAPASDIGHNLTLTGQEKKIPSRFRDGDFETTKALLESYLV